MRGLAASTVSLNKWPLTGISNQPGERWRVGVKMREDRTERGMEGGRDAKFWTFSSIHNHALCLSCYFSKSLEFLSWVSCSFSWLFSLPLAVTVIQCCFKWSDGISSFFTIRNTWFKWQLSYLWDRFSKVFKSFSFCEQMQKPRSAVCLTSECDGIEVHLFANAFEGWNIAQNWEEIW